MKPVAIVGVALLVTLCTANAVMGYALEQYDATAWWVYVASTILYEAWAIGRWEGYRIHAAVGISIVANLVTAFGCANCCGVGLHWSFVGSTIDPNPFMNMLVMFTTFGLVSGWIESIVWRMFRGRRVYETTHTQLSLRSMGAHLVWVPLGMAIMLVPNQPYPFLKGFTNFHRRWALHDVLKHLDFDKDGHLKRYGNIDAVLRQVHVPDGRLPQSDQYALAYIPSWGRFDTHEMGRGPKYEWNPKADGMDFEDANDDHPMWLVRVRVGNECFGYVTTYDHTIRSSNSAQELGYETARTADFQNRQGTMRQIGL